MWSDTYISNPLPYPTTPKPPELTDEDLDALERQCWIPTEAYNDAGCEYYTSLRRFARAAIAADRARR